MSAFYTWGVEGLISERLNPSLSTAKSLWYHCGPQGETRYLSNSTGIPTHPYVYTGYGVQLATLNATNPFKYGGQSGYYTSGAATSTYQPLILCGARWYDPELGRFLSRDPIGYDGGPNLFEYCGSNPVGGIDPSGLDAGWAHRPSWNDPYGYDFLDPRSEGFLKTLESPMADVSRQFVLLARAKGYDVRIIDGTRTYARQNELYAQGRSTPGPIVTKAKGGQSNHNFGVAIDIGMFRGPRYIGESPQYSSVSGIGKSCGLKWGGDWKGIVDKPHYEWPHGLSMKQLRKLHDLGLSVTSYSTLAQILRVFGVEL